MSCESARLVSATRMGRALNIFASKRKDQVLAFGGT